MTTEQNIYLQILAYGLTKDASITPQNVNVVNWYKFYSFCESQSILGIGLQCIDKLKKQLGSSLNIPQSLLLQWIGISEHIRAKNQLLNNRTKELTDFFADKGKRSCILKGQGNALMYPYPSLRTAGDIDVWLDGPKKDTVNYVHRDYPQINVEYHHMQYPVFDDVEVEVHYYPSFCYNKLHNHRLQKYFRESSEAQFNNKSIAGYCVPTNAFNLVFQLSHMMRHFFTQGIGLRHAIDYYYLLQQDISEREKLEAVNVMKRSGLYKFFCAVLWIEKEILGLDKNTDIAKANEKAGKLVLQEMLKGGSFGFMLGQIHQSTIATYVHQITYRIRIKYILIFPSETLSRPFALIWDYSRKHLFN